MGINIILLLLGIAIGLWAGSIITRDALLKMASYDKVMVWGKEDCLEPFTALMVLVYIRKNIRELV